jgi:hypothetical protein
MALDLRRPTAWEAARRTENPANATSHNRTVSNSFQHSDRPAWLAINAAPLLIQPPAARLEVVSAWPIRTSLAHSFRSIAIASTRVARRTGMYEASPAAPTNSTAAPRIVDGSRG